MLRLDKLRGFTGGVLFRYVVVPLFVAVGIAAIASGLVEGPALQPFLYGVF